MRDFIIATYSELVIIHYQLFSASNLWNVTSNIAPENRWLQDDGFLWDGATWQVQTVSFKGCRYSGSARMAPLVALPSWWPFDHESCITHGHLAAGSFCYVYTIHPPAAFEILHIWQATQSAVVLLLEYVLICFKIRVTVDCRGVMHMSYTCYTVHV